MDRYILSQRTRLSALVTVLVCCLSAFAVAVPKQEPAQDNAPLTVENFGKVNDHIYRGGQPKGDDYRRLGALGIKIILGLCCDGDATDRSFTAVEGMCYCDLSM